MTNTYLLGSLGNMNILTVMYLTQMERAISNLAFRGSILEAITEAKRQKKLFVVYISGNCSHSGYVLLFFLPLVDAKSYRDKLGLSFFAGLD